MPPRPRQMQPADIRKRWFSFLQRQIGVRCVGSIDQTFGTTVAVGRVRGDATPAATVTAGTLIGAGVRLRGAVIVRARAASGQR